MKILLREKFIAPSAYIKKVGKFHTSNLTTCLRALEQNEVDSPRRSRWQETIKMRVEINNIETNKIQRINKAKSLFFEKFNTIDKPLSKQIKRQRESIQIHKINNEK